MQGRGSFTAAMANTQLKIQKKNKTQELNVSIGEDVCREDGNPEITKGSMDEGIVNYQENENNYESNYKF